MFTKEPQEESFQLPEGSDALFSRNTKRRTTKPVKKERKQKSFLKRTKSVSWIMITNVFVLDVIPLITIIISIAVVVWFFFLFFGAFPAHHCVVWAKNLQQTRDRTVHLFNHIATGRERMREREGDRVGKTSLYYYDTLIVLALNCYLISLNTFSHFY